MSEGYTGQRIAVLKRILADFRYGGGDDNSSQPYLTAEGVFVDFLHAGGNFVSTLQQAHNGADGGFIGIVKDLTLCGEVLAVSGDYERFDRSVVIKCLTDFADGLGERNGGQLSAILEQFVPQGDGGGALQRGECKRGQFGFLKCLITDVFDAGIVIAVLFVCIGVKNHGGHADALGKRLRTDGCHSGRNVNGGQRGAFPEGCRRNARDALGQGNAGNARSGKDAGTHGQGCTLEVFPKGNALEAIATVKRATVNFADACGDREGGKGAVIKCIGADGVRLRRIREVKVLQCMATGEGVFTDRHQVGAARELNACQRRGIIECIIADLGQRGRETDGFNALVGTRVAECIIADHGRSFGERDGFHRRASREGAVHGTTCSGNYQRNRRFACRGGRKINCAEVFAETERFVLDRCNRIRNRDCGQFQAGFKHAIGNFAKTCGEADRRQLSTVIESLTADGKLFGVGKTNRGDNLIALKCAGKNLGYGIGNLDIGGAGFSLRAVQQLCLDINRLAIAVFYDVAVFVFLRGDCVQDIVLCRISLVDLFNGFTGTGFYRAGFYRDVCERRGTVEDCHCPFGGGCCAYRQRGQCGRQRNRDQTIAI